MFVLIFASVSRPSRALLGCFFLALEREFESSSLTYWEASKNKGVIDRSFRVTGFIPGVSARLSFSCLEVYRINPREVAGGHYF